MLSLLKRCRVFILCSFVLFSFSQSAFADLLIDQAQTIDTRDHPFHVDGNRSADQTFTAQRNNLAALEIKIHCTLRAGCSNPQEIVDVSISENDSSGHEIWEATINLRNNNALVSLTPLWYRMTPASPVPLRVGARYNIHLFYHGFNRQGNAYFFWAGANGNPYPNGTGSAPGEANFDFAFRTYYDDDVCPNGSNPDDIGDPCNHNDCLDGTLRDNVGDACNHNDCPDGSLRDGAGDACDNHDEDSDGILDDQDQCPFYPNDNVGDPCSADDNQVPDFDYQGPDHYDLDVTQGQIDQTVRYRISNTGTADLNYIFSLSGNPGWLRLIKNGGETNALAMRHSLPPGNSDQFTLSIDTNHLAPNASYGTVLHIASNDPSGGNVDVRISVGVSQAPYPVDENNMCEAPPSQNYSPSTPTIVQAADPVNTATGNFSYNHTDLALTGRGLNIVFGRTYNSQDKYLGPLGFGWTHRFNVFATELENGSVQIKWGDGHFETYTRNEGGSYTSPQGIFSELTHNLGGVYTVITKDKVRFDFSTAGQLVLVIDRVGNTLTLTYDDSNLLSRVEDARGGSIQFFYNNFKIERIADSAGREISFTYNNDNLETFTDPMGLGHVYRYSYDASHQLIEIRDPRGNRVVENTYDEYSRVISQLDGRGNPTTFDYGVPENGLAITTVTVTDGLLSQSIQLTYDEQFRIVGQVDALGSGIDYEYNSNNLRTSATNRTLQSVGANYDPAGNITALMDPLGNQTQFVYENPNISRPTQITTPQGLQQNMMYDDEGNLQRTWIELNGENVAYDYTYNEWGQVETATDPLNHQTTYEYNARGEVERIVDAEGTGVGFVYDQAGRLQTVTDPLGRSTEYSYNANNQVTQIAYEDGLSEGFVYDENGNLVEYSDRAGRRTTYSWNANNFLERIERPLNHVTQYEYDALNRIKTITDADDAGGAGERQRVTRFTYDALGNVKSVTDAEGRVARFDYDAEGRVLVKFDPSGEAWRYEYNQRGQVSSVFDPLNHQTAYEYDPITGRLASIRDALGGMVRYGYDDLGRVTSITDQMNQVTSYEYDDLGRLISLTNASHQTTTFGYDSVGRLMSQTNALGETERYFYNADDTISRYVPAVGQEALYDYDPQTGRLSRVTYADGAHVEYTYDAIGNRRTRTDALGVAQYNYDDLNRITSVTDPRGFEVAYGYDRAGFLTQMTYPGNHSVNYQYNNAGQLTRVTDWLNQITHYSYDAAGRLAGVEYPNGFNTSYSYDRVSRLTGLTNRKGDNTILSSYNYTLDDLGRRVQVDRLEPLSPQYLSEDVQGQYNEDNQMQSYGGLTLQYDANGNLTVGTEGESTTRYTFDTRDLLTSINGPEGLASFEYDGDGNRVSMSQNNQETQFVLNTNASLTDVIAETDGNGDIQRYYIYGLGLLGQVSADGSSVRYYHYDPLGSTIALSDAQGQVTDQYVYDPFGKLNRKTGNTSNPFQYVGKFGVQDDETGLHYMRARYYDPEVGRFISRDPIGLQGGLNLYGYAGQNPISFSDPGGLTPLVALVPCAIGAGVGLAGTLLWDIGTTLWNGKLQFSSGSTYVGNTVGGCVAPYTGLAAGFTYGTVSSTVRQGLENGPDHVDYSQVVYEGVVSAATAGILNKFVKIPNAKLRGSGYVEPQAVANEGATWNNNRAWVIKDLSLSKNPYAYPDGIKICGGKIICFDSKGGNGPLSWSGETQIQGEKYFSPASVLIHKPTGQTFTNFEIVYLVENRLITPQFEGAVFGSGGEIMRARFMSEGTLLGIGFSQPIYNILSTNGASENGASDVGAPIGGGAFDALFGNINVSGGVSSGGS